MKSHSYKRGHKIFWYLDTDGPPCSQKWVMPVWVLFIKDNLSYSGSFQIQHRHCGGTIKVSPSLAYQNAQLLLLFNSTASLTLSIHYEIEITLVFVLKNSFEI